MKLIIDISEERHKDIRDYLIDKDSCHALDSYDLREIIRNGIPLEEELEKIKDKLEIVMWYNRRDKEYCLDLISKRISELKGE